MEPDLAPMDLESAEQLTARRRLERRNLALLLSVAGAVVAAFLWLWLTQPRPVNMYLEERTAEERAALRVDLEREARDIEAGMLKAPGGYKANRTPKVLRIGAAVQQYAIEHGTLPHSLAEIGFEKELIEQQYRLASGGDQWRLFGPKKILVARGN